MKCYEKVECPKCGSDEIGKSGRNENGVQRYRCKNEECEKKTFVLKYRYKAWEPGVREKIIEMAINGSGTRDTGRVLKISKDTVTNVLKKKRVVSSKSIQTSKQKLQKKD